MIIMLNVLLAGRRYCLYYNSGADCRVKMYNVPFFNCTTKARQFRL